jgi:alpha-1,3/alpha-1,6-mannosyltransferase
MANYSSERLSSSSKNIVFVHPDLGIGGAERLVIDAAVGLQSAGHKVTVLTSYRDTNHCFEEARDGTSARGLFAWAKVKLRGTEG